MENHHNPGEIPAGKAAEFGKFLVGKDSEYGKFPAGKDLESRKKPSWKRPNSGLENPRKVGKIPAGKSTESRKFPGWKIPEIQELFPKSRNPGNLSSPLIWIFLGRFSGRADEIPGGIYPK